MIFRRRGGIPRFNHMLCLALDEIGSRLKFDTQVLSMGDGGNDFPEDVKRWCSVRVSATPGKSRTAVATLGLAWRPRSRALICGHVGLSPLGWLSRAVLPSGYAVVTHGREIWGAARHSWMEREALRRATRVFAVSRFTAERVHEQFGVPWDRIRILPNTLAPWFEDRRLELPETGRDPNDIEMLTVTRLDCGEQKGVDVVLKAVAQLAAEFPGLRYRVVGSGSDKARLMRLAGELGLSGRVIFEEGLSDDEVARRYAGCDFFVLPSGQEGFGIVYLEAMYFGKPCIAARAGGAPEVVDEGRTGLLVPYGDVGALAAAIRSLAREPHTRSRLGEAGRQRVTSEFLFRHFVARLEEHLREWLETEPAHENRLPG